MNESAAGTRRLLWLPTTVPKEKSAGNSGLAAGTSPDRRISTLAFCWTVAKGAAKGRVRLPGVGALGVTLARSASREDADDIAAQLEAIWWDAPDGFRLRSLLNGLDDGVPLPAEPPAGAVDGITIISPFLSPDFLKKAGKWGTAGSRTLISSMPALADMASRPSKPLAGFSTILAYAAPDVLADETAVTLPGNEVRDRG